MEAIGSPSSWPSPIRRRQGYGGSSRRRNSRRAFLGFRLRVLPIHLRQLPKQGRMILPLPSPP
jgi:hypothetical protein